jgi:V8-like Glu-specific endopeptidase
MKITLALLSLTLPLIAFSADHEKVIYGEDNRHDVYDYPDRAIVELSKSTMALVKSSDITNRGGNFQVDQTTFRESQGMCSNERFVAQPTAAFCSGFLVAPNKIVTAGHCITSAEACADVRFVFDYKMNNASNAQVNFRSTQIYSCKKILGQVLEQSGRDFAVIELDREVTDREPLKLSTNKELKSGDGIFVIGHPSGLPTKITDSAVVRNVKTSSGYFVGNLDTYGGNSGSAVFNTKTLEVEGILVRGERDYESSGNCRASYRIGETEGRGEDVTLISVIHERGFEAGGSTPSTPSTPTGETRYVWLTSDNTCNEFRGSTYIREVADHLCAEAPATGASRYVWLNSDMTCNEFRGDRYIREVPASLCNGPAAGTPRYVWLNSDMTCNEFRGDRYIREVPNALCGR